VIFIGGIFLCTIVKPNPIELRISSGWIRFIICGVIVVLIWIVFGQTLRYGFVNYDDPVYVSENPQIQAGLSWQNAVWAFTHVHSNNWHPLTTMSHMLDCQVFGLKPGAHHLVNLLIHSANAVLLFLLLIKINPPRIWSSAFVAVIFAIHPLRVESVVWISERKDVLSGLFFMLTLFAYFRYAQKQSVARYVTMSILFACGLLSKPMLVTLPGVLLLLDYWPLNRFGQASAIQLVCEKIPLFILSVAAAAATLFAQSHGVGLVRLQMVPFWWRMGNGLAAYVIYVWQLIWPAHLAVIYPHPGQLPLWQTTCAAALLFLITAAAFSRRKAQPYFLTGWFWYLIMLLPVIGLIQVGGQAHADRYTYLPQIGLAIAVTWAIGDLAELSRHLRSIMTIAAPTIVAVFAWLSWIQTHYWHDTERLWTRTLAVTGENDLAHFSLGEIFLKTHRVDEAIDQFQIVLAKHPFDPDVNFQIGCAFTEKNETDRALLHFQRTLKIQPDNSEAETNLANALLSAGRVQEAVEYYRNVLRLEPGSARAHYNLGVGLHRLGQLPEAIVHYKEVLAIDPKYPDAQYFLEQAESENGQKGNEH
jgi:protein O-mannosyl-transferase